MKTNILSLTSTDYDLLSRQDFMTFLERCFIELHPETLFLYEAYIDVMANELEKCRLRSTKRLAINLPPRSLKTLATSVALVAWLLAKSPSLKIICASYGQDLADKNARDCRKIMMTPWYRNLFPRTRLDRTKQSVSEFVTTEGGGRMSTSVGGVLTGRGADFIIIDDPLKPSEALSEPARTKVNQWFDNSLLSRLDDKQNGVIIIVMQRLHQDDLVGHVQESGPWEVLSFPSIAESDEEFVFETLFGQQVYRRKPGDILHPEREPRHILDEMRSFMGEYNFAAQYQQNPIPFGGAMVKYEWILRYRPEDLPDRFITKLQSWDTANKAGNLHDYSVCTTWGYHNKKFYLIDVTRLRLNYPDLRRKAKELFEKHSPNVILIEDRGSGTQLIQDLKADGLYAVKAYLPPSGSDKVMRLHNETANFENRLVLLPESAPWLFEYERELTSFPGSKYDDQVDSTTQALDYFRQHGSLMVWENLGRNDFSSFYAQLMLSSYS